MAKIKSDRDELVIARKEIVLRDEEKGKRAAELLLANKELVFQNKEKEKRAEELRIANIELAYQNDEKERRAEELTVANKELAFQNKVKEKRAAELVVANEELAFQNQEKEKRAAELFIANKELAFQNKEKEKRAVELGIANIELLYQAGEKQKRAAELAIADIELSYQIKEKNKRELANKELEALSTSAKLASQYARSLIEASLDPFVTISTEGKITDVNEALIKITGIQRQFLVGSDFSDYFTEPGKAREGYRQVFENGFIADYPLTVKHECGKLTDVLYNASIYKDEAGAVLGVFAVARDITEQKILQQRNDSFMSMASHELKTPVTTIKTLVQILQMQYAKSDDKTLIEYLATIGQQIEQLTQLVTDLLDVSKIKADKFELIAKPFDFDSLAIEIVKSCQLLSPQHLITLEGKTNRHISGDRNNISRVFINLITNAIKYSPDANKIIVTLSQTGTGICVCVKDFGIGIDEAHREKIFERFFQIGNDTGQSFVGLGIGLYISAAIVNQHKGRIWVEGVEDKAAQSDGTGFEGGSMFYFELPSQQILGNDL